MSEIMCLHAPGRPLVFEQVARSAPGFGEVVVSGAAMLIP